MKTVQIGYILERRKKDGYPAYFAPDGNVEFPEKAYVFSVHPSQYVKNINKHWIVRELVL